MITSVLVLAVAFAAWAALHSLTASVLSKEWARQAFGVAADRWYRLAYNILAMLTLLPLLVLLVLLPDRLVYAVPAPWSLLLRLGQGLALLCLGLSFLQTGPTTFLGLAQVSGQDRDAPTTLSVQGFYCRVRHPLYFFSILLIWLTPAMTVNWLALCVLFTLYFYLGALHEEQRLMAEFGPAYAVYKRRVPMLIPRPGRCVPPTESVAPSAEDSRPGTGEKGVTDVLT